MKRAIPCAVLLLAVVAVWVAADGGTTPTPVTLYFPTLGGGSTAAPSGHALPTAWRLFLQQYASPILLVLAVGGYVALRRSRRDK